MKQTQISSLITVIAISAIFQQGQTCFSQVRPPDVCCVDIGSNICFTNDIMFHFPQCPVSFTHQFILYVRSNSQTGIPFNKDSIPGEFNNNRSTIFIVHGWKDNFNSQLSKLKDTLLAAEDVNVVSVDWRGGAGLDNYLQSAANTQTMGALIGVVINNMRSKSGSSPYYYCMGHGLGAHVCGFIIKTVLQLPDRITGLNPAASSFYGTGLRSSSAAKVDIIHTDPILGLDQPRGTVDFYPNGGKEQPGCGTISSCNHDRAVDYMTTSIGNATCFQATQSCTYFRNIPGTCSNITDPAQYGQMGYRATASRYSGMLYMKLSSTSPYCSNA